MIRFFSPALALFLCLGACSPEVDRDPPQGPGPQDTGAGDTGAADTGTGDTGGEDTGSGDTGTDWAAWCESIAPEGEVETFYELNPTYEDDVDHGAHLAFSSPGDEGMDAALLAQAEQELEALPFMLSFLVLRNGAVVWESYFNGSEAEHANNVHSSSKSILADVAGVAVEQGYIDSLDRTVAEILPEYFTEVEDERKLDITVRHLLTMSAGFAWEEDFTEYRIQEEDDWLQAIVDLPLAFTPGARSDYCTGQSHLMSAVITRTTGMDTCTFAHRHYLDPLDMRAEHWGQDPQGIFSGGFNLYLTPRELAKFGLLHLQGGSWQGEQVVPRSWTESAVEYLYDVGEGYAYGYYWWLTWFAGYEVHIAWGYGGQLVYVIPALDLGVVFTTDTHDYQPDYDGGSVVANYVIAAVEDAKGPSRPD